MAECYRCENYNNCKKKVKKDTVDCFVLGDSKIEKPCKTCKFYCGTNEKDGDLCSSNGDCSKYYAWFLSKNGWSKIVAPFRKLRSKR